MEKTETAVIAIRPLAQRPCETGDGERRALGVRDSVAFVFRLESEHENIVGIGFHVDIRPDKSVHTDEIVVNRRKIHDFRKVAQVHHPGVQRYKPEQGTVELGRQPESHVRINRVMGVAHAMDRRIRMRVIQKRAGKDARCNGVNLVERKQIPFAQVGNNFFKRGVGAVRHAGLLAAFRDAIEKLQHAVGIETVGMEEQAISVAQRLAGPQLEGDAELSEFFFPFALVKIQKYELDRDQRFEPCEQLGCANVLLILYPGYERKLRYRAVRQPGQVVRRKQRGQRKGQQVFDVRLAPYGHEEKEARFYEDQRIVRHSFILLTGGS